MDWLHDSLLVFNTHIVILIAYLGTWTVRDR